MGEADELCPICGASTPLEGPTASAQEPAPLAGEPRRGAHAANAAVPSRVPLGKKRILIIAAAVVAIAAVVAAAFVARACSADADLREQASVAESSSSAAKEPAVRRPVDGVAIDAGNVAAGGIAIESNGMLFETSTDGVFYRDSNDTADDTARKLAGDAAYDLNATDDALYFLVAESGNRPTFEGSAIRSVKAPPGDVSGLQSSRLVYEPKSSGSLVGSLSVVDGVCYFLEHTGGEFALKRCGDAGPAEELLSVKAAAAWLFVERNTLYLVSATDAGWSVKRAALGGSAVTPTEVSKGEGTLAAVALSGGKLFYATESKAGDVHLQSSDLKGGAVEYADVVNPVRIAASGDVVAVMTKAGKLVWVDAVTGVSHDLTERLEGIIPSIVPTSAALSVQGSWVCVADGKDNFCRISTQDAKTVATV